MILSGSVGQSSPNRGAETSKQSLYINMGRLDSYRLLTRAILLLLVTEQLSFSGAFRPINSHIQSKLPDAVRIGAGALTLSKAIVPTYMQGFLESIPSEEIDPVFTNITNQQCISHVQYIMKELSSAVQIPPKIPETFILQMVDAWGKLPSGILSGHLAEPGDFQECIQARSGTDPNVPDIKGKYCLAYVFPTPVDESSTAAPENGNKERHVNLQNEKGAVSLEDLLVLMASEAVTGPLLPQIGTCFPSSCSTEDVQQFLNNILSTFNLTSSVLPCAEEQKPAFDSGDITMIVVIGTIVAICIVATLIDSILLTFNTSEKIKDSKTMKALLAFSWYTNTQKLLSTNVGKDNLGCLHGLRFFSITWVILGHTWSIILFQFPWNSVDVRTMYKSGWSLLTVINGTVCVDTFFVMGGALVAYNLLRELDKSKKINVYMLYIHRYLRLTPTYAILVGIMATLLPYFGNGPNWYIINLEGSWCKHNWWHNILYINSIIDYRNYPADQNMCYGESWYLSNDMLYFIVAPLFVYILWRWRIAGFSLLAAWLVQCINQIAVTTSVKDLSPTYIPFIRPDSIQLDIYTRPWTRSAPYTIGLLLGYILHAAKTNPNLVRALPRWAIIAGWTASTATALAVIYGPIRYFDPENEDEAFGTAAVIAYASLHRTAWAVVISWIIFACVHGYGGPVDRFLSWKPFMPFGRLCYCVYISSYHLQLIYTLTNYHPLHYSPYNMVYTFFSHFVASFLLGYILTITIESPFIQLEKLLFESKPRPKAPVVAAAEAQTNVTAESSRKN